MGSDPVKSDLGPEAAVITKAAERRAREAADGRAA